MTLLLNFYNKTFRRAFKDFQFLYYDHKQEEVSCPVIHSEYVDPVTKRNVRLFVVNPLPDPYGVFFHFRHWPPPPHICSQRGTSCIGTSTAPLWKCLHAKGSILHLCNLCVLPLYSMARAGSLPPECQRGQKIRGNPSVMHAAARTACQDPYFTPNLRPL